VSKKILIAGGTGLIGRELVSTLLSKGYSLKVLTRNQSSTSKNSTGIKFIEWDGHFNPKLVHEVEDCHAIINLAGESIGSGLWTTSKRKKLIWSRLGSTRALGRACQFARSKPQTFIQASAVGYYPSGTEAPLSEHSESGTGFLSRLTVDWEASAIHEVPKETRLVIIRTGVVLSTRGGMLKQLALPVKLFAGAWFDNGQQLVPWIHIRDEVNAIVHLLENDQNNGTYNLVSPRNVSLKTLVKTFAKANRRPALFSIPKWIIKLTLGQMGKELLLTSFNISAQKLIDSGFQFEFPQLPEAINNLVQKE